MAQRTKIKNLFIYQGSVHRSWKNSLTHPLLPTLKVNNFVQEEVQKVICVCAEIGCWGWMVGGWEVGGGQSEIKVEHPID